MTLTHMADTMWEIEPRRPLGQSAANLPEPLWQIFDRVAGAYADRTAIRFGDERITYRQLQTKAGRLARQLRGLGVGPDVLVGVFTERNANAIIALLAILQAGGAYLPLDPAYPSDRVAMIVEDAKPAVLLTESGLAARAPRHGATVIFLDEALGREDDSRGADSPGVETPASGPEHLAYVIYTSGSTGKPKGVMVTHANVSRLLSATDDWFHFGPEDVWTLFHSLAFDFSVWEIWGCLLRGGMLVVVPFAVSRSPEDFYELLVRERVTVLNQTPSAFYQLMQVDETRPARDLALRVVVFGGEALNFSALRPWFARHGDRTPRLINMYGITETTVHVTYREVTATDAAGGERSLIGVPIPDLQLYLLGDDRQPAAVETVGEIFVGGAGVARGYLNRPELNAERFLADPFSSVPGARMYKSGDLARRLADGEVEYLGRGDAQVKIQGFRIELGEVEAAIVNHAGVREARVIAHTDGAGNKRLVAYFVAQAGAKPSARELSEFLGASLPPWMLPSVYLPIAAFPLTPNGKVDYAALPAPVAGSAESASEGAAGATEMEGRVAEVWKAVLGARHIGLDDNFFDIGGTSLLLVSVHAKLQTVLTRKIPIADLFGYTTVRTLSERLGTVSEAGLGQAQKAQVQTQAQKQKAAFARARAMNKATQ
jgi:amino acid adenylation domain-containing protein